MNGQRRRAGSQGLFRGRENLLSLNSYGPWLDRHWFCSQPLWSVLPAVERKRITYSHARHWTFRLVWGNAGGLRRGRDPQFRAPTLSTYPRVEIRHLDTRTGVEGCRGAGTLVGLRWDWHVYLSDSCALATLIAVVLD